MYKFQKALLVFFIISSANLLAQFGKNKVQYENFKWMFIQSEHFDIYYNEGSKYLAEFTAINAEKSLNIIQNDLNFAINRRVPIIVYNSHVQFQQTNAISSFMPEGVGGVTELFKNRVVLPFDGNWESFRHVIAHELVHAVLNDMFYGGTFQTALSSSGMFEIPIWMNEGLAEWESLQTLTTLTDMYIRDLVINNYLPPLPQLDGYLAYRGGQIFYWHIATNYGREKIGELINNLNAYRNTDIAFKSTFNLSLEEFSDKWMKDLKKMYLPDVKEFQDPDDFSENLTFQKKARNYWNTSPAISPNGQKYAYIGVDNGVFAIFIRDIDKKSEPRKLVSSFRKQDFEELNILTPGISWNPQGTKIALSAKAGGENAIFIIDEKTSDYEKIDIDLKSITSVAWSPDGSKLAFSASLPNQSDIFVYDLKSKKLTNITNDVFSDAVPEWYYDSQKLFFVSDRGRTDTINTSINDLKIWKFPFNRQDIYSIDLTNNLIKRLTFEETSIITSIAAFQNPDKIFFTSDYNGISNLYELDLNTLTTQPKTNSLVGINQISISPDGSKLLFSGQVDGGYDIFMIRFPLEKNLGIAELPFTTYLKTEYEQRNLASELNKIGSGSEVTDTTKLAFGKYNLDLSRQDFIQPNPDAMQKDPNLLVRKSEEVLANENFVEKPYKIVFTPDAIIGNPNYSTFYGFQGVTQMMFSDILGDHQIYAEAYLLTDLKNSSFLVNYMYMPDLIDYGVSLYHSSAFVYRTDGLIYRYRNYGTSINAALPFDLFRRVEANLGIMGLSRENVDIPTEPSIDRFLLLPNVRYVFDNVLFSIFGPSSGTRYYIGITGTPKLSNDGVSFVNFDSDIRFYQPIIPDYLTAAIRGKVGASFGANPVNYYLGGTENWINSSFFGNGLPFDDPIDFAMMNYEMPARGWAVGQHSGTKFFMLNTELRFPLFTALVAGPVPILLQGVMGNLFLDIAGAFTDDFVASQINVFGNRQPRDLYMSAGIGARSYIFGLPIKLDVAWRNEYEKWSAPYYLFSLGYDF